MSPPSGTRDQTPRKKRTGRRTPPPDPIGADFGPGPDPAASGPASASGPIPGMPCGGEGCFLHPVANLATRFAVRVARGHAESLGRAAFSGIELMKAMRDFLDEEIAFAERAAGRGGARPGYEKIPVE